MIRKGGPHHLTHGLSHTRLYGIWENMKQRCYTKGNHAYGRYGGRGITVADEWLDFVKFYAWAIDSGYKDGLTIERIDVNGGYCPENCTWIPHGDQAKNTTRNIFLEYNGRRETVAEWSRITGIPYPRLIWRINKGWSVERALTAPLHHNVTRRPKDVL